MGVVPKRFVWSPFWQTPIKAPKHFAVVLGWPRFAVGVCLRALRAARPFSVSPPAGGFAGLARRRLGFASARPPFVSRFARRRPPASPARSLALRVLGAPSALASLAALRPGSAGAPLRASPLRWVARFGLGRRSLGSYPRSLLCASPPRVPLPLRGGLCSSCARGLVASLRSAPFPALARARCLAWFCALRFLPPPAPPLGGERCSGCSGVCRLGSVVAERKREVDKGLAWLLA